MLKDTININTYLNILVIIILFFFGFIFNSFENRFNSFENRFISLEKSIKENGEKIDRLISVVNDNRVKIAKMEEKQIYFESEIHTLRSFHK